jgi:teichoic acid transport system permease protein
MAHTAVAGLPPAGPDGALAPAELAARHGLRVAGERPDLVTYARQVWAYRHFITAFGNARVVASFTTTRLGQLWQVLTPLFNAGVYYLIFGVVLGTKHHVHNFVAYLCIGVFVFSFTQTVCTNGVQSISGNLGLIRALHFPRASLPIASMFTQLQQTLVSMLVLVAIVLFTGEPIRAQWLLVVPALLLQSMFNSGLALALARMGSKITDLKQLMPFITRTWFYASGVLYSVEVFDRNLGWAAKALTLNPALVFIELIRHALLTQVTLTSSPGHLWIIAAFWAVVVSVTGFLFFWRGEQEYGRG